MKSTFVAILLLASCVGAQPMPGLQVHGQRGSLEVGPGGTVVRQTNQNGGGRRWQNATLSRGSEGELILSDPEEGHIVMERGPQGKTRVQLKGQNLTVGNDLLLQWSEGQDVILEQLLGR